VKNYGAKSRSTVKEFSPPAEIYNKDFHFFDQTLNEQAADPKQAQTLSKDVKEIKRANSVSNKQQMEEEEDESGLDEINEIMRKKREPTIEEKAIPARKTTAPPPEHSLMI
jgi:hypothetical protein